MTAPRMTGARLGSLQPGWLRLAALAVIAAAALAACGTVGGQASVKLQGDNLHAVPAAGFQLADQSGATVSLSRLRGHPVVLAFVFTHCPDVCPLTAEKLRSAAEMLGARANETEWLAVSLDPLGDTPATAAAFVAQHGLTGRLHYLLGTSAQLQPVWNAYFIAVQSQYDAQTGTETIMHSMGLFVIDTQGRERVYLDDSYGPKAIADDVRALLAA
jgi:protein SCO1/2